MTFSVTCSFREKKVPFYGQQKAACKRFLSLLPAACMSAIYYFPVLRTALQETSGYSGHSDTPHRSRPRTDSATEILPLTVR